MAQQQSPKERVAEENFYKVSHLILDEIPLRLRNFFKIMWDLKYPSHPWNDDSASGRVFMNGVKDQHGIIMVKGETNQKAKSAIRKSMLHGNRAEWDGTTLFAVLLYSSHCLLKANPSTITCVDSLRELRNTCFAHLNEAKIDDVCYQQILSDTKNIFQLMGWPCTGLTIIDRTSLISEDVSELLTNVRDEKLRNNSLVQDILQIKADVTSNKKDIGKLQIDNSSTKQEIIMLKAGCTSFKNDFNQLQTHHTILRADIAKLQTDTSSSRTAIGQLQDDSVFLRADVDQLRIDNSSLKRDITELKTNYTYMKSDICQHKADSSSSKQRIIHPVTGFAQIPTYRASSKQDIDKSNGKSSSLEDIKQFKAETRSGKELIHKSELFTKDAEQVEAESKYLKGKFDSFKIDIDEQLEIDNGKFLELF